MRVSSSFAPSARAADVGSGEPPRGSTRGAGWTRRAHLQEGCLCVASSHREASERWPPPVLRVSTLTGDSLSDSLHNRHALLLTGLARLLDGAGTLGSDERCASPFRAVTRSPTGSLEPTPSWKPAHGGRRLRTRGPRRCRSEPSADATRSPRRRRAMMPRRDRCRPVAPSSRRTARRSPQRARVGRQNLMRPTDTHDANLLAPACCRLAGSASAAPACVPAESRAPMTDAAASRFGAGRTHQAPASDAVR